MQTCLAKLVVALVVMPRAASLFANQLPTPRQSLNVGRATATGRVVDLAGRPLENAMVMVYSAGVKKGYSLFCPTCYRDCGKRTVTDSGGNYTISGLNAELLFTLIAVREGYSAAFVPNVNPAAGPTIDARLKPMPTIKDPSQFVRGRVVDTQGIAMRGTVIQSDTATYRGPDGRINFLRPDDYINQLTVTNDKGEFEVAFNSSADEITLRVTARRMAPKHFTLPTGEDRKTIVVTDGSTIRGRLVYKGQPIADAEIGLSANNSGVGRWYPEVRVGTTKNGEFTITNVPPGRIWLLHPTMESLASRGIAAEPLICETKEDGLIVDLGDIHLKPAHMLRGRVVLSDAKSIPPEMQVTISGDRAGDGQTTTINSDGRFQFSGLPNGVYQVSPSVKGYRLAHECTIYLCRFVEVLVNKDRSDLRIEMEAEAAPHK